MVGGTSEAFADEIDGHKESCKVWDILKFIVF